ncbi:MAG: tRNA guanosine(34) transglycosylase Tgt [Deltaproteobacteria bacterium]|nr:tRNA guanosine(34) transglycosylase Tgt [Deltaproteobacteria bacterium]
MEGPIEFSITANDDLARVGCLRTAHGAVATPVFMPVGTRAAVKAMSPDELWNIGYRLVLANAYHLLVRPGPDLVRALGGVGRFMAFPGATLTDSGGFQAMSLAKISSVSEEGLRFRSHLDGAPVMLTPERAIEVQEALGADIMMALDECTPYPASRDQARKSLELTARWAERGLRARRSSTQALFGIAQGGTHADLRRTSALQITSLGFDGYAAGGLSVGEPKEEMLEMAALSASLLPADRPRYLMGVGMPAELLAAVGMGFDMFDCVIPTRNARNGSAFTSAGRLSIKRAEYTRDAGPLDANCECRPCRTFSRAYLRHLFLSGEILAARALTEHNLFFYARLMREARVAIASRTFRAYVNSMTAALQVGDAGDKDTD